jgi:hypothetical protein
MMIMMSTIIIIYCRYAGTTAARWLFKFQYLVYKKYGVLFEQKRIKSLNKGHFVENKTSLSSIS